MAGLLALALAGVTMTTVPAARAGGDAASAAGAADDAAAKAERTDVEGFEIIGLNSRGLFFGLESFGRRADGVPYSEIRIYDLRRDAEIDRSPFVYEVKEKIPPGVTMRQAVERARRGVYREASRVIRFLNLVPRGNIVYAEGGRPARALQLSTPQYSGMLTLETFPLTSPACPGVKTLGFRLRATGVLGETLIHEDRELPKSRGCPVDYGIAAVDVHQPYGDSVVLAVVVTAAQGGRAKGHVRHLATGHVYMRGEGGWR